MKTTTAQFSRFAVIGALGFLVDAGTLTLLLAFGLDPYLSRAVSITVAVLFTWLGNRTYTFGTRSRTRPGKAGELMAYAGAMALGAVINFGVYSLLIWQIALFSEYPVLAVAVSTLVAMTFNFLSARAILDR